MKISYIFNKKEYKDFLDIIIDCDKYLHSYNMIEYSEDLYYSFDYISLPYGENMQIKVSPIKYKDEYIGFIDFSNKRIYRDYNGTSEFAVKYAKMVYKLFTDYACYNVSYL